MADEKLNILTLAMAKKYTDKSLAGAGAVAGVPCQIQSITPITGGNRVTFLWVDNNNVSHTSTLDVMDGAGGEENKIDSISVNGYPISIDENKNVDITVPSIEGLTKDTDLATVAKSGSYEDLSNKPEIPSVEGFAKTTDIPTKVSELENDSNYLSSIPEEYVTETELDAKGYLTEHQDISGKVDKVEGKSLISDTEIARLASVNNYDDTDIRTELANKADTTAIPNKVSELTNDRDYQTAEQVNSAVTTEIAKVVADAPESLNTLKEMSDWIAGHENDASAMNSAITDNKNAITALQTGKADKSEIPSLTGYAKTSDLHSHTNKTVLDGITSTKVSNWDSAKTHADSAHAPSNAQANVIETVKVNGSALSVSDKAVDVTVPTKVSELNNDSGFITIDDTQSSATTTYSSSNIDSKLNLRREIRIGEIYDSDGYYKILVKGYYARPIYFRVVASNGGEEILSFGQSVVNSRKVIGKAVNTKFRYIAPAANGEKGTLLLRSNTSEIALTIFCTYMYGIESTPIIEASTAEEFNSGTEFTTMDKIGSTDISAIGDGTVTGAISTVNTNLGELSTKTTSTIVKTNATLLYLGAKQLGIEPTDNFYIFKITAFCEDGYNISLAKYKHGVTLLVKTISNSKTTITATNQVGTITYSGTLKCAYVEYIGVADESVDFGSGRDVTELATMDDTTSSTTSTYSSSKIDKLLEKREYRLLAEVSKEKSGTFTNIDFSGYSQIVITLFNGEIEPVLLKFEAIPGLPFSFKVFDANTIKYDYSLALEGFATYTTNVTFTRNETTKKFDGCEIVQSESGYDNCVTRIYGIS